MKSDGWANVTLPALPVPILILNAHCTSYLLQILHKLPLVGSFLDQLQQHPFSEGWVRATKEEDIVVFRIRKMVLRVTFDIH